MAKIGAAACSEIPRDGGNDGIRRTPERTARASEGCREKWVHGRTNPGGLAVIGNVLRYPRSQRSASHRRRGTARVELMPLRVAARLANWAPVVRVYRIRAHSRRPHG